MKVDMMLFVDLIKKFNVNIPTSNDAVVLYLISNIPIK
jgi:hypothetical protein